MAIEKVIVNILIHLFCCISNPLFLDIGLEMETQNSLRKIEHQNSSTTSSSEKSTNIKELAHNAKQAFLKGPLIRLYANLPLICNKYPEPNCTDNRHHYYWWRTFLLRLLYRVLVRWIKCSSLLRFMPLPGWPNILDDLKHYHRLLQSSNRYQSCMATQIQYQWSEILFSIWSLLNDQYQQNSALHGNCSSSCNHGLRYNSSSGDW